jgi:transcriptional regulator with XRE-family HTH domain
MRKTRDLSKVVAANVRRLQRDGGLSEEDIGRRTGLSQKTINNLLNATHQPTLKTLAMLAAGCGVELSDLVKAPETACKHEHTLGSASPEEVAQLERIYKNISRLPPQMRDKFEKDAELILGLIDNPPEESQ